MLINSFKFAFSFIIDKQAVDNAAKTQITALNLYVKSKPEYELNSVGMRGPGMAVMLVETVFGGKPRLDVANVLGSTRIEYEEILSSSDATVPTSVRFPVPVSIDTDKEYAIIVRTDGDSEYEFWHNTIGEIVLGTNVPSTGSGGNFVGRYFDYFSVGSVNRVMDQSVYDQWKPLNGKFPKFDLYVARYRIDGTVVESVNAAITVHKASPYGSKVEIVDDTFIIPSKAIEFVTFDQNLSTKETFIGGQKVYQNTFSYPGGPSAVTVATYSNTRVTANTLLPNGATFSWSTIFANTAEEHWLVLKNSNTDVDIRQVVSIVSNTIIELDEPVTFTNSAAHFMLTPTGDISSFDKSSPFGVSESILTIINSTANSSVRFVNNCIEYLAPVTGGSGYANSDVLYVIGYENVSNEVEGGYKAVGNLVTNTTGGITAVYMSNNGAGFVNTAARQIVITSAASSSPTSNTSAGSGATFSVEVGATLKTELRPNNSFRSCKVVNLPLSDVIPFFEIQKNSGTDYTLSLNSRYRRVISANTISGFSYYVVPSSNSAFELDLLRRNSLEANNTSAFVSRSNEYALRYANGNVNDLITNTVSRGLTFQIEVSSNSDYSTIFFNTAPRAIFSKYLINNDATNEHLGRGNAWARGISKTIKFGRTAEDVIVYLTAYRPANTDIKVYARLYNEQDPEAPDDKQWSILELQNDIYSSAADKNDYVELEFHLPQWPETNTAIAGTITASNNSSNLVGVGTTFTSDLANNDLIRIYPVLFPNTSILAVVNSVSNNTIVTVNEPITNNTFLGQTLAIEKVVYKYHGFRNIMNDNCARYHNSSMMVFDGYDSINIKIVHLSSEPNRIPRVDDVKVTGVTT